MEAAEAEEGLVQPQNSQSASVDHLDSAERRTVLGHNPTFCLLGLSAVSRAKISGLNRLCPPERI